MKSRAVAIRFFFITLLAFAAAPSFALQWPVSMTIDRNATCNFGDCSLREAIKAANANPGSDTVVLQAGQTYTLTIAGVNEDNNATGDLDITEDIGIRTAGFGDGVATIQAGATKGGGIDRVLHINPNQNKTIAVALNQIIIRNGTTTGSGGGIYFDGFNSTDNTRDGQFRMDESQLLDNTAAVSGGGMFAKDLSSCFLFLGSSSGNVPAGGLIGNIVTGGNGGGLLSVNCGLTVADGLSNGFKNNEASLNGGGLHVSGGAAGGRIARLFGSYRGNKADRDNNNTGDGGGIFIAADASAILLAADMGPGNPNTAVNGGAVANLGLIDMPGGTTINNLISNNTAKNHGGGIYNSGASAILTMGSGIFQFNQANSDNSGGGDGGAIYNNGGSVTFTGAILPSGAPPLKTIAQQNTAANGGAFANAAGTMTISTGVVTSNRALAGSGGAVFVSGGTVTLCEISFQYNDASVGGGAFSKTAGTLTVHLSGFYFDTAPTGSYFTTAGTAPNLEDNWWFCDGFPNDSGCGTATGAFDADPRIAIRLLPFASTIPVNGQSTLTADFTQNTNGIVPTSCSGTVRPSPVVLEGQGAGYFQLNGLGTIVPPGSGTIVNGQATATFQAGNTPGVAQVAVNVAGAFHPGTLTIGGATPIDLSVTKIVSNATPNVNQNVTFTVTVANAAGLANATGVAVRDILPSGLTFVSATPSVGTYNNVTGVWNIGSIPNGTNRTLQIVATVTTTGAKVNIAQVSAADQHDNDSLPNNSVGSEDDQASATVTPQQSDLSVAMTATTTTPTVGTNTTFTITVTNAAGAQFSTATNVKLIDLLPAGLSFVSATPSQGTYNSGTGLWDIGSLGVGSSVTLSLTAQATTTGAKNNTAQITAVDQFDPDSTPNNNVTFEDDQKSITINPDPAVADLSLTMIVNNATPAIGSNVTFTLALTNSGPNSATGVTVTDLLPAGLAFVSASATQGAYTSGTGVWNIGTLGVGSVSLDITATVNGSAAKTNRAQVTASGQADPDSTPNNNNAAEDDDKSVTVTPLKADLSLTKTVPPAAVAFGNNVTFTITVTNAGPSLASNVVIQDLLGAGLTFVGSSPSQGSYSNVTGLWTVGTINNTESATLQITATVLASGSKTNRAQVQSVDQLDPDSTPGNSLASEDDDARATVTDVSGQTFCVDTVIELNSAQTFGASPCDDDSTGLRGGETTGAFAAARLGDISANATVAEIPSRSTPYPSEITVSGLAGPIISMTVQIRGLRSPRPDDLDFMLVSPTGEKAMIMSDAGGRVQTLNFNTTGINVTLDDNAASSLPDDPGVQFTGGTFKPTDWDTTSCDAPDGFPAPAPAAAITSVLTTPAASGVFDGISANGTWQLFIVDDEAQVLTPVDGDILHGWCMTFVTNQAPVAVDDTLTTNEDTPGNVNVLTNDTDADGDPKTVSGFTQGANGSVSCTNAGDCTYTPNSNFFGSDSFDYTVTDGFSTDTGTVNVTVTSVDDPPIVSDDSQAATEDTPDTINVLTNDVEVDGQTLTVTSFTQPSNGSVNCTAAGNCTYTPNADYWGGDSYTYTVSDGFSNGVGTVNVFVNPVNDPPVAADDTLTTTEDNANSVNVLTNDTDVDFDTLLVDSFGQATHGSVNCTAVGDCTYTPNANYFGSDSFNYVVIDVNGATDTGTVNVTVTGVNDPPVAVDDTLTTNEDTPNSVNVVSNDTEVDGDTKTVTAFTQGVHGSVSCTIAGVCTYTPVANYFGPDTFDYTLSDGTTTDTGTVSVTVNSVNDNPVANDDTLTTNEDNANSVNVLTNDTDVENDSLTVTAFTQGAHGSVSCTAPGVCTYTPVANYFGSDTFDYTVTDANLGTDTGTVNVTVTAVNDPPVAVDDTLTTNEDTANSVNVVTNDTEVDGDTKTVTAFTQGAHGSVSCTLAGVCTYTPVANYFGSDTFDYTLSDGTTTDTGTVNVTVNSVNDNPVAVDDTLTTTEDNANSVNVLANDTDVENDARTVTAFTQGAHGSVSCTAPGVCTYTPVANYFGPDTFDYTVTDANLGTDTGTVNVTVTSVNDPPVAVDDTLTTNEDTGNSVNVVTNDIEVDGDPKTVTAFTQGAHGAVSCTIAGVCTYTPVANYFGSDTFDYTLSDGFTTDTGTVNVTVNSVNDNPVAVDDTLTTTEDNANSVSVLTNDTDVESDPLGVISFTQGANGSVNCLPNGDCTYTPNANYFGADSFTYTVEDSPGGTDVGTVNVTVTSVNDPPVAVDDALSTTEDNAGSVNVLTNDVEVDGDTKTVTGFTQGTHGTVNCTSAGVCTYTPAANYFGSDTFDYTLSDGTTTDTGTVNIEIASVNDNPVAVDDTLTTTEDNANSVNVLTNDTDVENDSLNVSAFTQGAHGTVNCTIAGVCTYTPNANYFGPDTFDYTVSDINGGTDTGTVSVTVSAVNDAPVAVDDTLTTNEDTANSVNVLTNDTEVDGDPKSVTAFTQGAHGTVSCTVAGVCTYTPAANYFGPDTFDYTLSDGITTDTGTVNVTVNSVNDNPVAVDDTLSTTEDNPNSVNVLTNDTDVENDPRTVTGFTQGAHGTVSCTAVGVCTYTPAANYNGPDSFDYTVTDSNLGSDTGTVSVTVSAVNDPPVAVDDTLTTNEDTASSVNVLTNDLEVDGDPKTVTAFTQGAHGTVSCTTAGVCTYTPTANYFGPDTFDYTLSDGITTDIGTVTVTVNSINDNPVAVDDTLTTNEDAANSVNVLTNDTDVENDARTVTAFTQGAHGTVSCTVAGVCTYTPAANYHGPDTFDYTVTDSNGGSDTGTVSVTVTSINDAPVAVDDTLTTNEDTAGGVNVVANDIDVDGDTRTVTAFTQGAHGVVNCTVAGICTYTPAANYFGPDTFDYTVSDGALTDTGTVNVTVTAVNDNPVAVDDSLTTNEDTAGSVNVLTNDTDVESNPLSVTGFTQAAHGAVNCTPAGSCTYTPFTNYHGPDQFTYTVGDGNGGSAVGTVHVTVTSVNDLPFAVNDSYFMFTGETLNVNTPGVLGNDGDPDGDTLVAQLGTPPASGTFAFDGTGSFSYIPAAGFTGDVTFTYRAFDGTAQSNLATVTITVSEPPPAGPSAAVFGSQTICEGSTATITALLTGNGPWTITWSDGVTETTASSSITRTVKPSTTTIYTITAVSDADGSGNATGSAVITVTPLPAAPSITAPASIVLGQPLTLTASNGYLAYQWYLNGAPIPGATGATYSVAAVTLADLGTYTVTGARGGCSSLPSAATTIDTEVIDAILAVVGATPGANGSRFDTTLSLFNPTSIEMKGTIQLLFGGETRITETRNITYDVKPLSTVYLSNFLEGVSGLASANLVRTEGGTPMALAHVFNDAGARGTFGMLQRARVMSDVLVRGDEAILIAPANVVTTRFNVGVRALREGATVRIVVRDSDGAILMTVNRSYAPSALTQQSASELIGRPIGASDTLSFSIVEGRAVIYGAATDNATNDPNLQFASRVQQASGNTYVIAVAGSTQGAFGSLFRTGVQLHNPNESPMSARFVLHPTGRSGSDGDPSMPITVGAHRTTSIADLLPAMSQTGLGSVDLVVESVLRPIASVRVFNDASDRQTSMTEDLATTSDAIKAGETASIIAPHDPAAARFNVGVRTLGSGARINATVRASDGTLVTTKTLDYPATFFVQSGAPDLLGVTLHGGESVMFEVVSGSALIYGVWTDNLTQDPSFHFAARK